MAEASRKLATYEDLAGFPEDLHVEIVDGEIYTLPGGLPRHGRSAVGLSHAIGGPFDFDPNGPGGWWIISEVDIELSRHVAVRPDLSGWRRERVPAFPSTLPIRIVPDWIAEVVSPSNQRHDRITKASLYARHGVPFYWLVDPGARVLEAFELQGDRWLRLGAWGDGDRARIRPFEAVEIDVGRLFPPPTEGELLASMTVSEAVAAFGGGSAPSS